jgi:hypothetical protein
VVSDALVATQRCGKHISAAVNQHATIEEAVFSVGTATRLYNEDFRQLELELRGSPELTELRRNFRKEIRLCREDFIGCWSDSETVTSSLPGYD